MTVTKVCDRILKLEGRLGIGGYPLQRLGPAAQLLGLGWYLAICIAGGTIGGHFLDVWLGTGKLLTVVGLTIGLAAALFGGYRMLTDTMRDMQQRAVSDTTKKG